MGRIRRYVRGYIFQQCTFFVVLNKLNTISVNCVIKSKCNVICPAQHFELTPSAKARLKKTSAHVIKRNTKDIHFPHVTTEDVNKLTYGECVNVYCLGTYET